MTSSESITEESDNLEAGQDQQQKPQRPEGTYASVGGRRDKGPGLREPHGMTKTKIYQIWKAMRKRCFNPNDLNYHHYGGRGITVCQRWGLFSRFFSDVGHAPFDGATLERKNNDGNYEPGNVVWATRMQQMKNTRHNHFITLSGETKHLTEWCRIFNVTDTMVIHRIKSGWSKSDLFRPRRTKGMRLTIEQVREIKKLRRAGVSVAVLCERFGIQDSCIYQILNGQSWKHA